MYTIYCNHNTADGFARIIKKENEEGIFNLLSITGINKINILIGSNNSGKSRFMRNMFLNANEKSFYEIIKSEELARWITKSEDKLFDELKNYYSGIRIQRDLIFIDKIHEVLDSVYIFNKPENSNNFDNELRISEAVHQFLFVERSGKPIKRFNGEKVYIPLMRGLNPLIKSETDNKYIHKDVYSERTNSQYFENRINGKEIFTGQSIFSTLQKMLLGDQKDRDIVKEYEEFLKINIFDNKDITLIPKMDSDTVSIKIGEEVEREIYRFGDGIQSLILLTFPIFMNKEKEMMFFIEEPDINMHPGMQRIFLETLHKCNFKHQYFLTTHSNHFLDLIFDYDNISIFMFKKIKNKDKFAFVIEKAEAGNIELLKQLGVNNSSLFLSNCTIWVEGKTDRQYMREYINRELIERDLEGRYIENLHYSFLEYGGSAISHLSCSDEEETEDINIKRISNKPKIVADFDRENKINVHNKRKEKLRDCYFYIKGVKEIENTLHEEIVKSVIAEYEKVEIEKLKFENPEFKQKDYIQTNLGKFIDEQLKTKKRKCKYAKDNTLNYKEAFAEKACKYIRDSNNEYSNVMSASAMKLAKKLVDFIEESNRDISNM